MQLYISTHFTEEALSVELDDPAKHFLLAFDNDELVGYAKLNLKGEKRDWGNHPLEIARLYTHPNRIGQGIGKHLMNAIEEYARFNQHDAIWLSAWQKNYKAVNFYQREGFRIIGTLQFVLGVDVQDDFLMMKKVG
jgi:GNAT superfamily N-acetyltransferase